MGVVFGFYAFKEKDSKPVEYVEDSRGVLTTEVFSQVLPDKKYINQFSDSEVTLFKYDEAMSKFALHGITEIDLDYLRDSYCNEFEGTASEKFFDAKNCYDKFTKLTVYIQKVNPKTFETIKSDIDYFKNFLLKHAEADHVIQGFWE